MSIMDARWTHGAVCFLVVNLIYHSILFMLFIRFFRFLTQQRLGTNLIISGCCGINLKIWRLMCFFFGCFLDASLALFVFWGHLGCNWKCPAVFSIFIFALSFVILFFLFWLVLQINKPSRWIKSISLSDCYFFSFTFVSQTISTKKPRK